MTNKRRFVLILCPLIVLFIDKIFFKAEIRHKTVKIIKDIIHKLLFHLNKFPYRIVNINKYCKISQYEDRLIQIRQTLDSGMNIYYYWEDIDNKYKSNNIGSYELCRHQINKEYPNIIISREEQEKD